MNKKAAAICAALVASIALLVVSSASAVQLTFPTGTKLPIGGNLLFTNVGSTFFKGPTTETQECPKSVMTGTLPHNGPEDITAEITSWTLAGTGFEETCTFPPLTGVNFMKVTMDYEAGGKKVGLPYCLTTTAGSDKWALRGGSCGSAPRPIKFKLDFYAEEGGIITFVGTCAYERTNIGGTFTTDTGAGQDAMLTFNKEEPFKRIELSTVALAIACPETKELLSTVTMETDTTSTADPIYAS